jgi:hypothetical protein
LSPWFDAHAWSRYALDALLVAGICLSGWLMQRRRRRLRLDAKA